MTDLISVLLTIRSSDSAVSVMKLIDLPDGRTGIADGELYVRIGQLREGNGMTSTVRGMATQKHGWYWYYDEVGWDRGRGFEVTKVAAIRALLAEGGYVQAAPNAMNPALF